MGAGYWGKNYIRLLDDIVLADLICVCDENQELLTGVMNKYPYLKTTQKIDEMLACDISCVIVSTPASTHYRVVKAALQADKNVLVEKPFTTDSTEGDELIAIAKSKGRILMVGHTFLFNNSIKTMKQQMEREGFGQLYYMYSTRTNLGPIRQDCSAVWDLASHDISIFQYLMDNQMPLTVCCVGQKLLDNEHVDVAFATFTYPGGIIANSHVSWANPDKVRETVVVGSGRRIVFNDMNLQEPVRIYERGAVAKAGDPCAGTQTYGETQMMIRDGDIISPRVPPVEPLRAQVLHFLHCVKTGETPDVTGDHGNSVVKLLEAIDRSLTAGGAVVKV